MKSVDIDDDLYDFVLKSAQVIGEDASSILRRLLKLPPNKREIAQRSPDIDPPRISREVEELLRSSHVQFSRGVVGRFLEILSWLQKRHPVEFREVLGISGRKRKYFASSESELAESGNSVAPKQIGNSTYWVITNNSTATKRDILAGVLQILNYSPPDRMAIINALEP